MKTKVIALTGILFALTLIIGTIENLIPPIIPALPFVKIGLSNIVITFSLIICGFWPTLIIAIGKSIIVPLFVGNPMMIAYSLMPTIIALTITYFLLKTKKIGMPTIGAISAITHNILQLSVASIIMSTITVFGFAPYLIVTGCISGFITGLISILLVKYLPNSIILFD